MMSYHTPEIIVDTAGLSNDDWLEYRRQGIGGSDAAILFGQSPWETRRGLYYNKIGEKPIIAEEDNFVAKEVGHLLEPLVAELFQKETGYRVYKDTNMYRHPDYPFMLVNLDYMVELPDGRKAILECKTGSVYTADKWKDGMVPANYETQCRHEMAVMGIDICFIARLLGNLEDGFGFVRIDRDEDIENDLIQVEEDFWQYVTAREVPSLEGEDGELAIETLRKYVAVNASAPAVKLSPFYAKTLREIKVLQEEKSETEKVVTSLAERIKTMYVPIIDELGSAMQGECVGADGSTFTVTYKPSVRNTVDAKKLKADEPIIYEKYVKQTESRRFCIAKAS